MFATFATDWTYDEYIRDVNEYSADDDRDGGANYNAYFISHIKSAAQDFLSKWKSDHNGKLYDHGYAGDAFADEMMDWFSDFYKDCYGQRPHLPTWYYVYPLGLPTGEDTLRTFCASPIEDACEMARETRARFAEED